MRRRLFIAGLGAISLVKTSTVRAQTAKKRIGALMNTPPGSDTPDRSPFLDAFKSGLKEVGLEDGKNVMLDVRWPGFERDRIEREAQALVASAPDVIFTSGSAQTAATRRATASIPIVFAFVADPIGQGFIETLAHPGGNVTGFLSYEPTVAGKWLDLLKQVAPTVAHVGALYNPDEAPQARLFLDALDSVAHHLAMAVEPMPVRDDTAIEHAVEALAAKPGGGVIVLADSFFGITGSGEVSGHAVAVIAAAARYRLPAIYPNYRQVQAGGLIGYGVDVLEPYRRAAGYVYRILKGEKPADLPVQEPTKFTLAVNLKTAKALGLAVPLPLLGLADAVIE